MGFLRDLMAIAREFERPRRPRKAPPIAREWLDLLDAAVAVEADQRASFQPIPPRLRIRLRDATEAARGAINTG
jgi:hypothetical protein